MLAACGPEPAGQPVIRTEIGSGKAESSDQARFRHEGDKGLARPMPACTNIRFEDATLTDCIADPAQHQITTDLSPDSGPDMAKPYRGLANFAAARAPDAPLVAFAMNGGMFDAGGRPIGYYVEKGKRIKELSRSDGPGNFHLKPNGVFYGTAGKWRIRTTEDFYAQVSDRPQFGTQSGPMLVIDGKLHPEIAQDGPSRAVRNGVGIDKQGRAHFVISKGAVSFGKISRFFRDVAQTPNALYLDGNVSALWDPASGRIDNASSIGPLIVVEHKRQ